MLPGKLTSSNYNFQLGTIKYPFKYNDLGVAKVMVVDSVGGRRGAGRVGEGRGFGKRSLQDRYPLVDL